MSCYVMIGITSVSNGFIPMYLVCDTVLMFQVDSSYFFLFMNLFKCFVAFIPVFPPHDIVSMFQIPSSDYFLFMKLF